MDERSVPSFVCEEFCRIVDASPQATALRCGLATMSYKELDRKSSQFAAYLAQSGIMPGSTVALCLERSFDWVVAALGIMRSGSAYLPLDSGWSVERLCFAIQDSGAALLVASSELGHRLGLSIPAVDPERDASLLHAAGTAVRKRIDSESTAYVIYTSGSTGVPKGVEITHANLAHLVSWHVTTFALGSADRMSHLAGLGFDAAVWEIWPTLATGATLCLSSDAVRVSPDLLRDWLCSEEVTISFVPTALAKSMITMKWPETTSLRFLLTGGDVLPRGPIEGQPFQVVNNYGPTEGTVVATSGIVKPSASGTPSIGHEITGTLLYLLDERGEPVEEGTPGEIYIGGRGVARGYRNQAGLTHQFFLPDPYVQVPGARMYRTGDIAVRQADGELDFRGRRDRQVKIRGQRVELDEISSVLGRHPDVEFATAIAKVSDGGDSELIAYVLPKKGVPVPRTIDFQKYLLVSIPTYMVPSTFVRLESLPVSPNGKIDFTMLELPNESTNLEVASGRKPETLIEERLLEMIQELLGNRAVTLEDDFFLVGGHSLIGMQLILRLRETFGVNVTLRQLFQSPTVERLAAEIEAVLIEAVAALSDEEADLQLAE